MVGLVFLILGCVCALVSRVILFIDAARVSAGWAVGSLFPFGPLFFRLRYPAEAARSRIWRLAMLPCLLGYFVLGPGLSVASFQKGRKDSSKSTTDGAHYALEKKPPQPVLTSGLTLQETSPPIQDLEGRRQANNREIERLRVWNEALRLRRRDLLKSDAKGCAAYDKELAEYVIASEKAMIERKALWPAAK